VDFVLRDTPGFTGDIAMNIKQDDPSLKSGFTPTQSLRADWRKSIQAAKGEDCANKLAELVRDAETAIFMRLQELDGDARNLREREDIDQAIRILRDLQVKKLGYPRWPGEI
jgi:hypothetical protein